MKTIFTLILISVSIFSFGQKKFKKDFAKADSAFKATEVPVIETRSTHKKSIAMTDLQKAEFAEIDKIGNDYQAAYNKAIQELKQRFGHSLMLILDAKGYKLDDIVQNSVIIKSDSILFNTKNK